MNIRFCNFSHVLCNIPPALAEGARREIAHLITDLVSFDKKEKGVVATAQDTCQPSPKEEMESLLWQIKVRLGAAAGCFHFSQGELVISCHANCASLKDSFSSCL